jgi:hypothetical protein
MRTLDIPGGKATFREKDELTVAGQRAIAKATRHVPRNLVEPTEPAEGEDAPKIELDLMGFPVDFGDDELEAAWMFNDTLILVSLDSWTLDRPLPKTREDLGELPSPLYAGLNVAIAIMQRAERTAGDDFGPDGVEDQTSPTGA